MIISLYKIGRSTGPVNEETSNDVEDISDDTRDLMYKKTLHDNSSNYIVLIWKRVSHKLMLHLRMILLHCKLAIYPVLYVYIATV